MIVAARSERGAARVLLIGVGGLGSPLALALALAGVGTLGLADDDVVEASNLHRQILFGAADVGVSKTEAAARALRQRTPGLRVEVHEGRLLPGNAAELVRQYDVVVEGADNFATKFLAADACLLAGVPLVHGAAVRWRGTALAVSGVGAPCYRCVFEDLPEGGGASCAEAGVMGPVVGVVAAFQADLALGFVDGRDVGGTLVTFDGKTARHRRRVVGRRAACPLCGPAREITSVDASRYTRPDPDAAHAFV